MPNPGRIYRLLLKLYPARFREEYSGPLARQFQDDYQELGTLRQHAWFWLSAWRISHAPFPPRSSARCVRISATRCAFIVTGVW